MAQDRVAVELILNMMRSNRKNPGDRGARGHTHLVATPSDVCLKIATVVQKGSYRTKIQQKSLRGLNLRPSRLHMLELVSAPIAEVDGSAAGWAVGAVESCFA